MISVDTTTPSDIVSVLEPLMVLFIAAPALIRGIFRLRAARSSGTGPAREGVERMSDACGANNWNPRRRQAALTPPTGPSAASGHEATS